MNSTPTRLRTADPGLIGLLGFVIASATAQLEHLGVVHTGALFWVGAVFGGAVQIIAGLLSYFKGDDFFFLVYSAFGWYWIVSAGFTLGETLGIFEVSATARGLLTLCFALLTIAFSVAGATHNSILPITLLAVGVGLLLQGVETLTGNSALGIAGTVVLLAATGLVAYMGLEKFYWATLGRHVVPLGKPWISLDADHSSTGSARSGTQFSTNVTETRGIGA